MNKTSKRVLTLLVATAVLGFAGYRVWQAYEKKDQAAQPRGGPGGSARVVSVSLTQATTGSVRDEIEISGSLKPKEQVDVMAKITGRVERIRLQVGDYVKRGEIIAELEDSELTQQVRRAEAAQSVVRATLDQRKAELSNAKADLNRAKQLVDSGLISRQEYETKLTGFRIIQSQQALTEAQGEQAEAELNELKIRLEQMRILAPISGYISLRSVDVGAVVSPSTPIVRIVNVSTLVTVANVPERQVGRVRVGNKAVVSVETYGDHSFVGRVARINPVLDAATRSAVVEVEIPNPDGLLRAEMFARVKVDLGTMRDSVLIPRQALVYRGQQPGVFVVDAKKPSFQMIETGSTQGQHVEVLGNLAAGTTIVNRGAAMLNEGDEIRVMERVEAERVTPEEAAPPKPQTGSKSPRSEAIKTAVLTD